MTFFHEEAPLRRKEASRYLQSKWNISRTPGTLAKLAVVGGGPKFKYAGRLPMYPVSELDSWAEGLFSGLLTSTAAGKNHELTSADDKRDDTHE